MKHLFPAILIISLCSAVTPGYTQVAPCGSPGKITLCDASGNKVISNTYDTLLLFNHQWDARVRFFVGIRGGKILKQIKRDTVFIENPETGNMDFRVFEHKLPYFKDSRYDVLDASGKVIGNNLDRVKIMLRGTYDGFENHPHDLTDTMNSMALEYVHLPNIDTMIPLLVSSGGKWGVLNIKGKQIAPFEYDRIEYRWFNWELHYQTWKAGKTGLLDGVGKVIAEPKNDHIYDLLVDIPADNNDSSKVSGIHAGSFAFIKRDDKTGVITPDGKELVPAKYDALIRYNNRLWIFNSGGKYRHLEVKDTVYFEDPDNNFELTAKIEVRRDSVIEGGKFGIVDFSGKEIVPAKYDFIELSRKPKTSRYTITCYTGGEEVHAPYYPEQYRSPESDAGAYLYRHYLVKEAVKGGTKSTLILDGEKLTGGK